ncbi:MAG: prepilin-type N-terminal cleavage/methylation domain-containing protein [Candidatus Xenobiia bacterium LiM19]
MMNRQSGFSLIESLISLFLLLFSLLFLFGVFSSLRRGEQLSENRVNASMAGKSLLSGAARGGFDAIAASSGVYTLNGTNDGKPFSAAYSYTLNVQSVDTDKKLVWVTLTWDEKSGRKNVTLETIYTKTR